jgi:protoheme IX farnesyltransferase
MKGLDRGIKPYIELCKPKISLFSVLSAAMGFLLSAHRIGPGMLGLTCGVFLLSCGACALNHYQDRKIDAVMLRTAGRPLPSGRIRPATALNFALALISCGSLVFVLRGEAPAFLLGLFAVFWYNVVYAFLKRRTAFSVVPGSLVGAVPPAMGWVSGGGELTDHRLVTVCFFFFMWQAPHFWLLLMDRGEEYKRAGLPSPMALLSKSQLRRILFVWINSAAVSALFIPLGGVVQSHGIGLFLLCASFWLVYNGVRVLREGESDAECIFAFRRINAFVLIVMLLLSLDELIRGFAL